MRYINIKQLLKKRTTWGKSQTLWRNKQLQRDFRDYFYDKCWYTEHIIGPTDAHIDHFRPKARITQFEKYEYNFHLAKTGYYWLKNDPTNYRFCCAYANRKTGSGGKGTYFPLQSKSCLLTPNGKQREKPLLIDPCKRKDVNLITFIAGKVEAASANALDQERVKASVKIFNLNHYDLVRHRITVWETIKKRLAEYQKKETTKEYCIKLIKELISPEKEYSACAIACVNSIAPDEIKAELDLLL